MCLKNKQKFINIELIEIPSIFIKTPPQSKKYNRIKNRCEILKGLDKVLQVRVTQKKSILLQDGYIRYLVAKELGFKLVPVIINNNVIIHL